MLKEHSENVARLAAASCDAIGLKSLGALVGLLHDCQKAAQEWQAYLKTKVQGHAVDQVPHAPQAARWIWQRYGQTAKGRAEKVAAQIAAMAVYSHHNTLFDVLAPDGKAEFRKRLDEKEDDAFASFFEDVVSLAELDELFCSATREVQAVIGALEPAAKKSAPQGAAESALRECRDFFAGLVARFVFSALIDADRYDAACFEAGVEPAGDDCSGEGWEGLVSSFEANLGLRVADAIQKADPKITAARQSISDSCCNFAKHGAGVYRLYVPTGAGKSFAALRFALHHAAQHGKSRVIVVEPYLTIIDQIAEEYRGVLGEHAETVLEYHSNMTLQEDDDSRISRLLAERFDSKVVVTTLVQFLDTLFSGKGGSARRLRSFANAVIILDEIQAIPAKCVDLFNLAARFLVDVCKATVVLCTATQPAFTCAKHPLRLDEPKDLVPDFEEYFPLFRRAEVIHQKDHTYTPEELAEFIRTLGEQEQSVLAVVNTKSAALALFSRLAAEPGRFSSVFFLSTHMCPAHRLDTIGTIKEGLANGTRLIVVSTSLIEFGVDLSFDCFVRSLAGVPSIAQVAGRCNRHGKYPSKRVFIVEYAKERLSALREIEIGRDITNFLLRYLKHHQRADTDLLSPDVISKYYASFFKRCEPYMCYKAETGVSNFTTLIELLGSNQTARGYSKRALDDALLMQSFETANRQFRVIEDGTVGILVPYGDGKRIIEELGALNFDIGGAKRLLREAQRFTVNVFENKLRELFSKKCIHRLEKAGVIALKEGFYDPRTGVFGDAVLDPDRYMI